MLGALLIAKALKSQGVTVVFGVVGIPVIEVAEACRVEGITFVGMRNEQSAAYAANAWGYLTGKPGICLVVSGPGFVHALSGTRLSNAKENCWPMILLAGSSDTYQESKGAFQEMSQVQAASIYTKYSARPSSAVEIPFFIEKAFRSSIYGRPGPCYIDLPGDYIVGDVDDQMIKLPKMVLPPPLCLPSSDHMNKALFLISNAKSPLIIIGKGANFSFRSNESIQSFVEQFRIPFLSMPMAKGIVSDHHELCVASARSFALQNADVIILLGARLNWMLHFGKPPRYSDKVCFVQVDLYPEELGNNSEGVGLWGDISLTVNALERLWKDNLELKRVNIEPWLKMLQKKTRANVAKTESLCKADGVPLTYYQVFDELKSAIPDNHYIVSEGANTMDIGRTILNHKVPKRRLDAGSFGTMGVGMGFAVASQIYDPTSRVVCVQGDSAFGFSGMDFETICRLKLPIVVIIVNNNGIYSGLDKDSWKVMNSGLENKVPDLPSTSLLPEARYEKIAEAFGGIGYFADTRGFLYPFVD